MNIKTILRWCAVPFAATIGAFVFYAILSLWVKGNSYGFEMYNGVQVGSITQIILALAAQAVFGGAFVFCGTMIAPTQKLICSIVLTTVIGVLSIISLIFFIVTNGFVFMQFTHTLATLFGAIATAKFLWTENKEKTAQDSKQPSNLKSN